MRVKILGSSAGGGFPQWNCACANCARLRSNTLRGQARTQVQLACELDSERWFLINASPDLRSQIEREPCLQPSSGNNVRQTPITSVILTSAELDGVLGLLLMREFQPLDIYATPSVRRVLTEGNTMFRMLHRESLQARWHDIIPNESFTLKGANVSVICTPVSVQGKFPEYVEESFIQHLSQDEAAIGLIIQESVSGRTLLFAPSSGMLYPNLIEAIQHSDVLLWDGTFGRDDELIQVRGSGKKAHEMGHMPILDSSGSLLALEELAPAERIFIHINNTNPILDEESPEYHEVLKSGWSVAKDGMEILL